MNDMKKRKLTKRPVTVNLDLDVIAAIDDTEERYKAAHQHVSFSSLANKALADAFLGQDQNRSMEDEE